MGIGRRGGSTKPCRGDRLVARRFEVPSAGVPTCFLVDSSRCFFAFTGRPAGRPYNPEGVRVWISLKCTVTV